MKKKARGAPLGNCNAAKDESLDGFLHGRCLRSEKGTWKMAGQAAGHRTMMSWIRAVLNREAKKVLKKSI